MQSRESERKAVMGGQQVTSKMTATSSCSFLPSVFNFKSTSAVIWFTMACLILYCASAAAGTSVSHGSSTGQQLEWGLPVVAALSAVVFVVVAVVLLGVCTDCYKSEVSSDFHPATAHTEVRWGGAAGYTAAPTSDPVLSSGFAEDLGTGGSQALPYTMIPSQVPESQGFRGYGTSATPATQGLSGYSMAPPPGPTGYTGNQGSQHLPGAHISPASAPEPDEPPPSYSALSNY